MAKTLRIGILHYHLIRGGVRTVVYNHLCGLIAYGPYQALEIDLITCDADQPCGIELLQELNNWAANNSSNTVKINQVEIQQLAYNQTAADNKEQFLQEAQKLSEKILAAMDLSRSEVDNPYVLYVHNGNLGKNPYLTMAIKLLADKLDEQNLPAWLLYQMHDFAEDNRAACWAALRGCSGSDDPELAVKMMYPAGRNITWTCINSRDKNSLLKMGLDPNALDILPNSVDVETFTAPPLTQMDDQQLSGLNIIREDFTAAIKNRIQIFADREGFYFDRSRRILLSPIKAVRRKNVAESILLLMMLNQQDDKYQLLVTMPANSQEDVDYCLELQRFVKKHQLPAVIGLGSELLKAGHKRIIKDGKVESYSLVDMLAISHAVVTTSIQEGFGYVFHEPWLAGKAVIGRNIPDITSDFSQEGMDLNHLYDNLFIPQAWLGERWGAIRLNYQEKISNIYESTHPLSPITSEFVEEIIQQKLRCLSDFPCESGAPDDSGRFIDWGDLDYETQFYMLEVFTQDGGLLSQIIIAQGSRQSGKERIMVESDWFLEPDSATIHRNGCVVADKYSMAAITGWLVRLIQHSSGRLLDAGAQTVTATGISNESVFARSLKAENVKLLV